MRSLKELADLVGGELIGDPSYLITGIEEIESADATHITFLENHRYQKYLASSKAGAVILHPSLLPAQVGGSNYIVHPSPSQAFQGVVECFLQLPRSGFAKIHSTAVIHPTATLHESVSVGPHVVIDADACIGAETVLDAAVFIGPKVSIGSHCHIHPKVVIEWGTKIGDRVSIQAGTVIGSDGFGYHTDQTGKHHALKQLGNVIIEDDVEIGANTTIDRARFKSTQIGCGTKIDNLVQIAHQVSLGPNNLIVAQVGIAGSTKTGKQVVMGGQAGVAGHISLADHVVLTARCAVSKSLEKPDVYYGAPAMPDKEFKRHFLALRKVERLVDRFQVLEKRFAHLLTEEE